MLQPSSISSEGQPIGSRGFPDLASREPMKAQFYDGQLWKRELEDVMMPMLEKYDLVLVDDWVDSWNYT